MDFSIINKKLLLESGLIPDYQIPWQYELNDTEYVIHPMSLPSYYAVVELYNLDKYTENEIMEKING